MESLSTAEHIENLTAEYRTLTAELGKEPSEAQVHASLVLILMGVHHRKDQ